MKAYMVTWPVGEKISPQLFFYLDKDKAQELFDSFEIRASSSLWPQLLEIEIIE